MFNLPACRIQGRRDQNTNNLLLIRNNLDILYKGWQETDLSKGHKQRAKEGRFKGKEAEAEF